MAVTRHASSEDLAGFLQRTATVDRPAAKDALKAIFARHRVGFDGTDSCIQKLVREIELDGGNTIASLARKRVGVAYAEVVRDAAAQLKLAVPANRIDDILWIEQRLLGHVVVTYLGGAPQVDKEAFAKIGLDWQTLGLQGAATTVMWAAVIQRAGAQAVAQVVRQVVLRTSGWFAARAAAGTALEVMTLAIPVVNVAMTAGLAVSVAGPAYRKTVPTVLDVALLRLEYGDAAPVGVNTAAN